MSKNCIFFIGCLLLSSCGDVSFDLNQYLKIEMYGIAEEPSGATGTDSPKSQSYVLSGVSLASEDGLSTIELYSGASATTAKIANRPQIIYTKDLTDYAGTTFSGFTVSFSATVKGTSKYSDSHTFSLSENDYIYTGEFTAETGKDLTIYVKLKWRNTVSETEMKAPDFDLSIESL